MKKILMSTAIAVTLLGTAAYANGSEPVFWDDAKDLYYYKEGNKVVYLPTGVDGRDGVDGVDGVDGADGAPGAPGLPGADGEDGRDGVDGVDGEDGRDGVDGEDGRDGVDGEDGRDGRDVSVSAYRADLSAVTGLAGVELRQGSKGVMSWSLGVGTVASNGGSAESIAGGLHYGIEDNWGVYLKVSRSLDGDATAAFVGVEGQF